MAGSNEFSRRRAYLAAHLGIALLVATAFSRTAFNGFIRYDDPAYLLDNKLVQSGLSAANVRWAFEGIHVSNWHPLTWLSHMLDCQLFGLDPAWHHLESDALHAIAAMLLLHFMTTTTRQPGRSFIAAALWAIHPLRVESVAWAAERKDVLSVLFGLACLVAYARYARAPSAMRYAAMLFLFILSLLAKATLVTMPALLLLLDWWPLRRVLAGQGWRRLIVEKLPLVALSIAFAIVAVLAQKAGGSLYDVPASIRLQNVLTNLVRYIDKLVRPTDLALFYPARARPIWQIIFCGIIVAAISAVALKMRRTRPHVFVGWFWFLGTILPVVGIVQAGYQSIANRYTYWPTIGLLILIIWELADRLDRTRLASVQKVRLAALCSGIAIAILTAMTIVQTGYWHDTITVFSHDLEATDDNFVAHAFLGNELAKLNQDDEAAGHDMESLRIYPASIEVRNQLASLMLKHGNLQGAIEQYRKSIELQPFRYDSQEGLGLSLASAGELQQAEVNLRNAVLLNPGNAQAHFNLAVVLSKLDRREEAQREFDIAGRLDPGLIQARNVFSPPTSTRSGH